MSEEILNDSTHKFDGISRPEKPKSPEKSKNNNKIKIILAAIFIVALAVFSIFAVNRYLSGKKVKDNAKTENQQSTKEAPKTVTAEKIVYVGVSEGLRLRDNPDINAKVLSTLPYGSKLTVLEEDNEWYKVVFGEATGWCSKRYTSLGKPKDLSIRDVDFSKIVDVKSELSSIQPIQYLDYNQDGQEEALVTVLYEGSGGYRDFYVYGYKEGLTLTKYLDARPGVLPGAFVDGFKGHDEIIFDQGKFVLSYPVYKKEDPNCCPTGGKEYVNFKWNGNNFVIDSKENK